MNFLVVIVSILFAASVSLGSSDSTAHAVKQLVPDFAADCHADGRSVNTQGDTSGPGDDCDHCISCIGTQIAAAGQQITLKYLLPIDTVINFPELTPHVANPEFFLLRPPILAA